MTVLKPFLFLSFFSLLLLGCNKQDTCAAGTSLTSNSCTPPRGAPNVPTTSQGPGNISKVTSFDDFADKLFQDTNKVAVLVLSSPSNCSACRTVDGYLAKVAANHSGKATYYLADPAAAQDFQEYVVSLPTFYVLTHYGEEWDVVDGWEGANNQSFVESRVAGYFQGSVSRMAAARSTQASEFGFSSFLQKDLYR